MNIDSTWPTTIEDARAVQRQIRARVDLTDSFADGRVPELVAGIDAGYEGEVARCAIVVLRFPELTVVEHTVARAPADFPYIPGFLSFREGPAVLAALAQLQHTPDLLIFDGQGIAHPTRCGIASHIGVLTDLPSIGCAKSRLIGEHDDVPDERGAAVPLWDRGEPIGEVLRSRANVKPLFISPGHRVSIERATSLVMACVTKYRLPETTRLAHNLASNGVVPEI